MQSGTSTTHSSTRRNSTPMQQRPLRPDGVDAGQRGDGEPARARMRSRTRRSARRYASTPIAGADERRRTAGCRTPPTLRYEHAVRDLGQPRLRDPLRAGRGEREHVVVRDAVVEDVLAGAQVPEERVVGQRSTCPTAQPNSAEERGEDRSRGPTPPCARLSRAPSRRAGARSSVADAARRARAWASPVIVRGCGDAGSSRGRG